MKLRNAKYILKTPSKKDQRASRRLSGIELAASFGGAAAEEDFLKTTVNNISAGGLSFCSQRRIKTAEKLKLKIEFKSPETILLEVKVVWVKYEAKERQYHIGVQIIEKETPSLKAFLQFYNDLIFQS